MKFGAGTFRVINTFDSSIVSNTFIHRNELIRINIEDYTNIDYIYCLTYRGIDTMKDTLGQGDVFECKLYQPQRCSQEILDFANFYQMHHHSHGNVIIHKH